MGYSTHRPDSASTFELVKQGLALVEISGVVPLLEAATSGSAAEAGGRPADGFDAVTSASATPKLGRPQTRERLTARSLLTLIYVLSRRNRDFTWAALVGLIFGELDDASRASLGMTAPYWSDDSRCAQVVGPRSDGPEVARHLPQAERIRAKKEFKQLANQIGFQCKALMECIDTTTLAANKKHTVAELRASQEADADLDARAALRDEVVYRLIRASLVLGNDLNYGTKDLKQGIFKSWDGHIGIDETKARVTTGMHPGDIAPALQLARQTAHDRHLRHPDVVGLQSIIALSGSAEYTVPAVCLGIGVTEPGTDVTGPVLAGIDLIQRIDPSLIPPVRTKKSDKQGVWHRYVVGDRAYPQATGLNTGLIERNFGLVGLPLDRQRPYERLAETGSTSTEGPVLARCGSVMCPGVNKQRLTRTLKHPGHDATQAQRDAHAEQEAYLTAFKMGQKWRLPELRNIKVGRPKAGEAPEQQYKLQVACPATEGRVLCPLVRRPEQETRDLIERGVPSVEAADLPKGESLPTCCGKTSVVNFDDSGNKKGVKYWQPLIAESSRHWAIYNPGRSRTEAYFSVLKSPTGGNFTQGRTEWKRGSMWSLTAAMAAVETNLRFITSFVEKSTLPVEAVETREESEAVPPAA